MYTLSISLPVSVTPAHSTSKLCPMHIVMEKKDAHRNAKTQIKQ